MISEANINESCELFGAERFGPDLTQGALNSYVVECKRDDAICFLKVSGGIANSIKGDEEALQYVQYFAENSFDDIRFAKPLPSVEGNLVEGIDGGKLSATLIEKAPGIPHENVVPFDDSALVFKMGRIGGRIHKLSRDLPNWFSSRSNNASSESGECRDTKMLFEALLDGFDDPEVAKKIERLMSRLDELPRTRDVYGFGNLDMNWSNFTVSEDAWTIFDFSGVYCWFLTTAAGALGYMNKIDPGYWLAYWNAYRAGYEKEYPVDPWWWQHVPLFLEGRRTGVYAIMYKNRHLPKMKQVDFAKLREPILNGVPIVDFDFTVR